MTFNLLNQMGLKGFDYSYIFRPYPGRAKSSSSLLAYSNVSSGT